MTSEVDFGGTAYEAKLCHGIPPYGKKNGTHQHSSALTERLWKPNNGHEHSEAMNGAFHSGSSNSGSPPLV